MANQPSDPNPASNMSPTRIVQEMYITIDELIKTMRKMDEISNLLILQKNIFHNFTSEEIQTVPEDLHEKFTNIAIELMRETIKNNININNNNRNINF